MAMADGGSGRLPLATAVVFLAADELCHLPRLSACPIAETFTAVFGLPASLLPGL